MLLDRCNFSQQLQLVSGSRVSVMQVGLEVLVRGLVGVGLL